MIRVHIVFPYDAKSWADARLAAKDMETEDTPAYLLEDVADRTTTYCKELWDAIRERDAMAVKK